MTSVKIHLFLAVLFFVICMTWGQGQDPVRVNARLTIRYGTGGVLRITSDTPNIDQDIALRTALNTATSICTIGLWRLYPQTNYLNASSDYGYIYGNYVVDSQEPCDPVTEGGRQNLTRMKSIRHLGPSNISVKSITFYEQFNYVGNYVTYSGMIDIPSINLTTVRSYVITAPYLGAKDSALPDITLYKVFDLPNYQNDGEPSCIALVNDIDGGAVTLPSQRTAKLYAAYNTNVIKPKIFKSLRALEMNSNGGQFHTGVNGQCKWEDNVAHYPLPPPPSIAQQKLKPA